MSEALTLEVVEDEEPKLPRNRSTEYLSRIGQQPGTPGRNPTGTNAAKRRRAKAKELVEKRVLAKAQEVIDALLKKACEGDFSAITYTLENFGLVEVVQEQMGSGGRITLSWEGIAPPALEAGDEPSSTADA